jgi:tetratricopeptide (TPR) repeat protein
MLTGRPPVEGDSREEVLRKVVEGRIVPPRQVNPEAPRQLEAICLKCLDQDPHRRYPSAAALAAELRRFLRPVPWFKFVSVALAGLLAVGVVLFTWYDYSERQDRIAEREAHIAEQIAEQEARIDKLLASSKKKWDEAKRTTNNLAAIDGLSAARNLLDQALLESPVQVRRIHLDAARITVQLTERYYLLRNFELGKVGVRDALSRLDALGGLSEADARSDTERDRRIRADAHHWRGCIYQDEKNWDEALKSFQASRKLWDELRQGHPTNRQYRRYLARSFGYCGDVELEQEKADLAWHSYKKSDDFRKALSGEDSSDAEDHFQYGRSQWNFGTYHERHGEFEEALKYHEKRAHILDRCHGEADAVFQDDCADTLVTIAELRMFTRPGQDREGVLELLARAEKAMKADRGLPPRAHLARGKCHWLAGQHEHARQSLSVAVTGYRQLIRDGKAQAQDHYRLAQAHAMLAQLVDRDSALLGYHEASAVLSLQDAVKLGYRWRKRADREQAFAKLRTRKDFSDALEKMAGAPHRAKPAAGF